MKNVQTWNNLLQYIKMNLGVPINAIELNDNDIINYIRTNTLVEFSNYVPKKKRYLLTNADLVNEQQQKYRINTDDYIIDILDVYIVDPNEIYNFTSEELASQAILAKLKTIDSYLSANITWDFEQPNYLVFYAPDTISSYLPAIVIYNTTYDNLNEIPSDMYQLFKKLALADIKILLGNMRTKYQLSTPFGQVINNGEMLKQEGLQERQIIIENLANNIPPDKFIVFV